MRCSRDYRELRFKNTIIPLPYLVVHPEYCRACENTHGWPDTRCNRSDYVKQVKTHTHEHVFRKLFAVSPSPCLSIGHSGAQALPPLYLRSSPPLPHRTACRPAPERPSRSVGCSQSACGSSRTAPRPDHPQHKLVIDCHRLPPPLVCVCVCTALHFLRLEHGGPSFPAAAYVSGCDQAVEAVAVHLIIT